MTAGVATSSRGWRYDGWLDSDKGYCDVVAFIGCGLLLGCNAVLLGVCILVHICGLFACVLRTTSPPPDYKKNVMY